MAGSYEGAFSYEEGAPVVEEGPPHRLLSSKFLHIRFWAWALTEFR